MKKWGILLCVFVVFFPCFLKAQETHLSQFYTNQQNLNPALIGDHDGLYRVASNYRNQWRQIGKAPIVTSMISFDHKFYLYSDEISAGLLVVNDQFSTFGLNTSKIYLTGSYSKNIAGHNLRAGLQFGAVLKSFNLEEQSFPNQWVYGDGEFNTNLDNMENDLQASQNFIDFNMGVAWSKSFGKFKAKAGLSVMHLNTPTDSYYQNEDASLGLTPIVHGEILYRINSAYLIEPKFSYMRASKAQNGLVGANVYKEIENDLVSKLQVGVLYRSGFGRNQDAIIPIAGLTFKKFDIGMSYDFNIGDLSELSSNKGTYEISIVYTAPAFLPKKMAIPCDRY